MSQSGIDGYLAVVSGTQSILWFVKQWDVGKESQSWIIDTPRQHKIKANAGLYFFPLIYLCCAILPTSLIYNPNLSSTYLQSTSPYTSSTLTINPPPDHPQPLPYPLRHPSHHLLHPRRKPQRRRGSLCHPSISDHLQPPKEKTHLPGKCLEKTCRAISSVFVLAAAALRQLLRQVSRELEHVDEKALRGLLIGIRICLTGS